MTPKSPTALRTIREVADLVALPTSVLRFWESQFVELRPLKLRGNRRYYRPRDVEKIGEIKDLLYVKGYSIKGARALARLEKNEARMTDESPIEHDLLGEIKPRTKKSRAKTPKLELVATDPLTLDQQKRAQLESVKAELQDLQDILRPYF